MLQLSSTPGQRSTWRTSGQKPRTQGHSAPRHSFVNLTSSPSAILITHPKVTRQIHSPVDSERA
eukprot:6460522-Amphidinium_carterae.1